MFLKLYRDEPTYCNNSYLTSLPSSWYSDSYPLCVAGEIYMDELTNMRVILGLCNDSQGRLMTKMGKFCWLNSKYAPIEHQPGSLLSYVMYHIEYLCITHFISSHYFPLLIGYHLCMQYYYIL